MSVAGSIRDGCMTSAALIAKYDGIDTVFAMNMTLLTITATMNQCSLG